VSYYRFYSTIVGVGILVGNLAVGSLSSVAHRMNCDEIVWTGMVLIGIVTVLAFDPA
jgi:hypothetical protein